MKTKLLALAFGILCALPLTAQTKLSLYNRVYAGPNAQVGDIPYTSATTGGGVIAPLHPGTNGNCLQLVGGLPTWQNVCAGTGFLKLDGTTPMTGNLDMGGNSILDLSSITAGSLVLDSTVTITTPSAGDIGLGVAKASVGNLPIWKSSDGATHFVQRAMWRGSSTFYRSGGSSTNVSLGITLTQDGTGATFSTTTTAPEAYNSRAHSIWTCATGANTGCGFRANAGTQQYLLRGDAAGIGGFFFYNRYGISTWTAGNRVFAGVTTVSSSNGQVASDPSSFTTNNFAGFGKDAADSTISFMTGDGSAVAKTSIASLPTLASGVLLDLFIFAFPNDTKIYYRVDDVIAGTTIVDTSIDCSVGANHCPSTTSFMAPAAELGTGANSGAAAAVWGLFALYAAAP